jgi:hypothetical protein
VLGLLNGRRLRLVPGSATVPLFFPLILLLRVILLFLSCLLAHIVPDSAQEAECPLLNMVRQIPAPGSEGLDKTSFDQSPTANLLLL